MSRQRLLVALVLSALLVGCAGTESPAEPEAAANADEVVETDSEENPEVADADGSESGAAEASPRDEMYAEPNQATADSVVALHFPREVERGEAFILHQRDGDQWEPAYLLIAVTSDVDPPAVWWPFGAEGSMWNDVEIAGPGPQFVLIPDTAPPGEYLICPTRPAELCASLQVQEDAAGS